MVSAVLRPPPPAPQARKTRPPTSLAAATALVLEDDGARVLQSAPEQVDIAVETSTGHHLRLTLRPAEILLQADLPGAERMRDEEHGGWIELDFDEDIEAAAEALVERLQQATGWHVDSEDLSGFDPAGPCPGCGVECFEWQESCALCGTELPKEADDAEDDEDAEDEDEDDEDEGDEDDEVVDDAADETEDDADRRARRLVQGLLREQLLELCTSRGAASVESAVAAAIAGGSDSPEKLLDLLTSLKEVSEVYADEDQIARWVR